MIWQDTLVSLLYGRPSCITVHEDVPSQLSSSSPHLHSFTTSCNHLFITANKISQEINRATFSGHQLSLAEINYFRKTIEQIVNYSTPHLRDIAACQNRDECIQHNFFRAFVDSVILCLCRPAVLSHGHAYNTELADIYFKRCRSILQIYLELLRLNCPIRRSWVFVHVTLSCALTLGLAANTNNDASDKLFLKEFLETFSQTNIFAHVPSYQNALHLLRQSMSTSE